MYSPKLYETRSALVLPKTDVAVDNCQHGRNDGRDRRDDETGGISGSYAITFSNQGSWGGTAIRLTIFWLEDEGTDEVA